jgi:hypothetical protein
MLPIALEPLSSGAVPSVLPAAATSRTGARPPMRRSNSRRPPRVGAEQSGTGDGTAPPPAAAAAAAFNRVRTLPLVLPPRSASAAQLVFPRAQLWVDTALAVRAEEAASALASAPNEDAAAAMEAVSTNNSHNQGHSAEPRPQGDRNDDAMDSEADEARANEYRMPRHLPIMTTRSTDCCNRIAPETVRRPHTCTCGAVLAANCPLWRSW